jgi:hypothetical protein
MSDPGDAGKTVYGQPVEAFGRWGGDVATLCRCVAGLVDLARRVGADDPTGAEWHDELFGKLRPQVCGEPTVVAAVCGGTNTGKSLIASALVGRPISRSVPEAARTLHPVASLPRGLAARIDPAGLFPGFTLVPWRSESDALEPSDEHRLVWMEDDTGLQPSRLVLLDTPDIDGTLRENWRRAELVRTTSDIVVAVLTQQKYNDAAVREFFSAAADAGKSVVVVFNMLDWPRQAERVPGWLDTFTSQTGIEPLAVYAAPWDGAAADAGKISFYPLPVDAARAAEEPLQGRDIVKRLVRSDFDRIKRAAMAGALDVVVDSERGAGAWLASIERRGAGWQEARRLLEAEARVDAKLPAAPREVVWNEFWKWLEPRRSRFDLAVSAGYRFLGGGLSWAGRRLGILESQTARQEDFAAAELDGMRLAMGDFLDRLDLVCRRDPLLAEVLAGRLVDGDRAAWFNELRRRHAALPVVSDDYRTFVRQELDRFAAERPGLIRLITAGLNVGAVVRPAVTVALGLTGAAAVPAAAATAGGLSVLLHQVGDIVVGGTLSLAGEGAIGLAADSQVKPFVESLFTAWTVRRCGTLADTLRDVVLGDALSEIAARAAAAEDPRLVEARAAIERLAGDLGSAGGTRPGRGEAGR